MFDRCYTIDGVFVLAGFLTRRTDSGYLIPFSDLTTKDGRIVISMDDFKDTIDSLVKNKLITDVEYQEDRVICKSLCEDASSIVGFMKGAYYKTITGCITYKEFHFYDRLCEVMLGCGSSLKRIHLTREVLDLLVERSGAIIDEASSISPEEQVLNILNKFIREQLFIIDFGRMSVKTVKSLNKVTSDNIDQWYLLRAC